MCATTFVETEDYSLVVNIHYEGLILPLYNLRFRYGITRELCRALVFKMAVYRPWVYSVW